MISSVLTENVPKVCKYFKMLCPTAIPLFHQPIVICPVQVQYLFKITCVQSLELLAMLTLKLAIHCPLTTHSVNTVLSLKSAD